MKAKTDKNSYLYGTVQVCKADHHRLIELDLTAEKLKVKLLDTTIALADNDDTAATGIKRRDVLQQFIDQTYSTSINTLEEEKQAILKKYTLNQRKKLSGKILPTVIALILIFAVAAAIFTGEKKKLQTVYINPTGTLYHTDFYCVKLASSRKDISLKAARQSYLPCKLCVK